jgi:type I restriction enzyme S subunit
MFGDPATNTKNLEISRLEDLLAKSPQNGLYLPAEHYEPNGSTKGVEMVHMADAFYEMVERGNLKRVNIDQKYIEKYALSNEDLLIARRSLNFEGAAKPCRIPKSNEPLVFESSLIRITPDKSQILPLYLYHYLSNEIVRNTHVLKFVTQSTISGINQEGLKNIEVMLPPLAEQERFAAKVARYERLRAQQGEATKQTEMLFQSLLERSFSHET